MLRLRLILPLLTVAAPAAAQLSGDQYLACRHAQTFVERRLKAPSTAKFQDCETARVVQDGSLFTVYIIVDAQNSYGAMLRSTFVAKLRKTETQWHLTFIEEVAR